MIEVIIRNPYNSTISAEYVEILGRF
jgi:hypothetical protein